MSRLARELRWAWRGICKRPGFALPIVVSLGLAIGSNTAIFAFINALFLLPLPFDQADRLIRIREVHLEAGKDPVPISVTPKNYMAWKALDHVFEGLAADRPRTFNLAGNGDPERVDGGAVTANFLSVVGVRPILGRGILPQEDRPARPDHTVLLSYGLWQRRFGTDPHLLGRTIRLDEQPYTVVGILPPKFKFPYGCELWVPLGLDVNDLRARRLIVFGRLAPHVTFDQARHELEALAARLAKEFPETNSGWSVSPRPVREDLVGKVRPGLFALVAAAGCLLLIACGNAASLLLAQGVQQSQEMSVRAALGARGSRLVLPWLSQGLILAFLSGGLGLLITAWALGPLSQLSPVADMDYFFQRSIRVDVRVLAFGLAVAVAVGVLFSIAPGLRVARPDLEGLLREGGRSGSGRFSRRLLSALVIWEVAVAAVLLTGATLMVRSFQNLQHADVGFDTRNLLTMEIALPATRYPRVERQAAFFTQLLERVKVLPGVRSAAITSTHPFSGDRRVVPFSIEDRPPIQRGEILLANYRVVSPDFFATLKIPILQGRAFTLQDRGDSSGVAVVSKQFAKTYWPGQSPLGKRIKVGGWESTEPWLTVIGLADDVKDLGDVRETWYLPYLQGHEFIEMNLIVRAASRPASLARPICEAVWSLERDQPVFQIETMEEAAAFTLLEQRFSAMVYAIFGTLGMLLAAVGIYGVMSYAVGQRIPELGVRTALGARPADLGLLILRWAGAVTLGGVGLGVVGAFIFTRLLSSLLYGVAPADPWTFAGVCVGLAMVGLAASYLPARRASRIDPVSAMRGAG